MRIAWEYLTLYLKIIHSRDFHLVCPNGIVAPSQGEVFLNSSPIWQYCGHHAVAYVFKQYNYIHMIGGHPTLVISALPLFARNAFFRTVPDTAPTTFSARVGYTHRTCVMFHHVTSLRSCLRMIE